VRFVIMDSSYPFVILAWHKDSIHHKTGPYHADRCIMFL
jgi:hypothetical protein